MQIITTQQGDQDFPVQAMRMHEPPTELYYRGPLSELMKYPRVAIVGSRNISAYGRQVTNQLARRLAERGIVIISGLALGVDAQAHEGALAVKGMTIAVLPSPVHAPAPATNRRLAERIVTGGGVLISQYHPDSVNHKGNFVARNELVAALSKVIIVTEAAQKSGSLQTVEFAHQLGRDVLAVPGNITSPTSAGAHKAIKEGAGLLTSYTDVLESLGITGSPRLAIPKGATPEQQTILNLMGRGITGSNELLSRSQLSASSFNQVITCLEISGTIISLGMDRFGLAS